MDYDIAYLNKKFIHTPDGKLDSWRIFSYKQDPWKGDCDDYAVTYAWFLSNRSILAFIFNILFFRIRFYLVALKNGDRHIVLRYKGQYVDNIFRTFVSKSRLINNQYEFKHMILPTTILVKLILGIFSNGTTSN